MPVSIGIFKLYSVIIVFKLTDWSNLNLVLSSSLSLFLLLTSLSFQTRNEVKHETFASTEMLNDILQKFDPKNSEENNNNIVWQAKSLFTDEFSKYLKKVCHKISSAFIWVRYSTFCLNNQTNFLILVSIFINILIILCF